MGISVIMTNNNAQSVIDDMKMKKEAALEAIGMQAETYAKLYCPVGTPESTGKPGYIGGTLRGSIGHQKADDNTMCIGTNVEYAPYVELGTYKMRPRHYLKKACTNHVDEYKNIIEEHMKD